MFDFKNYFDEDEEEPSGISETVATIGIWLLHACKIAFLVYSGVHGISAAWNYAGSSEWQKVAQIVGILVIELTLFGLYLAYMNGGIKGPAQTIAAGITYAAGLILALLGIVADSQINAELQMSGWLVVYLKWGLPLAPGLMAIGGLVVHALEPSKLRERERERERHKLEEQKFKARMANERMALDEAKAVRAMQMQSRQAVLQQLYSVYSGDEVQKAISATAIHNAPALLRAAGIDIEGLLPATVDEQEAVKDQQALIEHIQSDPDLMAQLRAELAHQNGHREDSPFLGGRSERGE